MRLSWSRRIYHRLRGPNPLHPKIWEGRLSPVSFRKYKPDDLPQCLDIYSLNEPGRFPELDETYEATLKNASAYTLVAEKEGRIIASGSLQYCSSPDFFRKNWAALCFGLVHPEHQRKGLGTALVLARIALLKTSDSYYRVVIGAVAKSIGFYQRFGFVTIQPWKDKQGNEHPTAMLEISRREILNCRELLEGHEIRVPADQELVPTMEIPAKVVHRRRRLEQPRARSQLLGP